MARNDDQARGVTEKGGKVISPDGKVIPQKYHFREGWVAMSLSFGSKLSEMKSLNDARVFGVMLMVLAKGNAVIVSQSEVAKRLGMRPSHVSRSIRSLIDQGLIIESERTGVHKTYMLNPSYGWRGNARSHQIAVAQNKRKRSGLTVIEGGK